MSALTNALDRIRNWSRQNIPEEVSSLPPGLTNREIEEIVEDLPFPLPQEVYELYKWTGGYKMSEIDDTQFSNDTRFSFEGSLLLSLSEAVTMYRQKNQNIGSDYQYEVNCHNRIRFQIFFTSMNEEDGYIVIDSNSGNYEVIFSYWRDGVIAYYSSLTSMMLTLAEAYERGICCSFRDREFEEIWLGYNFDLLERRIVRLEKDFSTRSVRMLVSLLSFLEANRSSIIKELIDSERMVNALIVYLKNIPLSDLKNLEFRYSLIEMCLVTMVADMIKDTPVVELLVLALKDGNWLVRYWASLTIGWLEDTRAIGQLREAFENGDRQMQEQALSTLCVIKDSTISSKNNYDWQFLTEAIAVFGNGDRVTTLAKYPSNNKQLNDREVNDIDLPF